MPLIIVQQYENKPDTYEIVGVTQPLGTLIKKETVNHYREVFERVRACYAEASADGVPVHKLPAWVEKKMGIPKRRVTQWAERYGWKKVEIG